MGMGSHLSPLSQVRFEGSHLKTGGKGHSLLVVWSLQSCALWSLPSLSEAAAASGMQSPGGLHLWLPSVQSPDVGDTGLR